MKRVVSHRLIFGIIGMLLANSGCVPVVLTASFTAQPTTGTAPLTVQFTDTSAPGDSPVSSWTWDFGDGGSSTDQNPLHTYQTPGVYTVSLTVMAGTDSSTETQTDLITVMDDGTSDDPTMVTGMLRDVSGAAIEGVPLRVLGTDLQGTSGPGGAFSFDDVPSTIPALAVHARTADGEFFVVSPRLMPVGGGVTDFGNLQLAATMTPRFPGQKLPLGDNREAIAVADFDGDLIPDIAVGSENADAIEIYFGRGDGSFDPRESVPAIEPYAIAAGDVNDDGVADFLVSSESAPERTIILSNGDRTFSAPVELDNDFAENVLLADLNGDGALDSLATEGELEVHLNDGAGNFNGSADYEIACCDGRIRVADLNGDSVPDVVTGGRGSSEFSVLFGNGDGTLQDEVRYAFDPVDFEAETVAIVDIDSDGDLDLLFAGQGTDSDAYFLLNNGTGTFGAPQALSVSDRVTAVATGDVNNDGIEDVVAAIPAVDGIVALLLDGQGGANPGPDALAGDIRDAVAVGDFDFDGNLDVVAIGSRFDNEDLGYVAVLLGRGDGSFGAHAVARADTGYGAAVAGLVNGDSIPDIVAYQSNFDGGIEVIAGLGDGAFAQPDLIFDETSAQPQLLLLPSGGGRSDIIVGRRPQGFGLFTFLAQDPNGVFGDPVNVQLDGDVRFTNSRLALANMDGEAGLEIVFLLENDSSAAPGALRVYDLDQNVTELDDNAFDVFPLDMAIADFNEDDFPDVVVSFRINASTDVPHLRLYFNNGDGTLTEAPGMITFPGRIPTLGAGDFDKDGNADILLAYRDDGGENWFVAQVLFGNGDGTFEAGADLHILGDDPEYMAVADINGDGNLDAAMATVGTLDLTVLIGNGNGTFEVERYAGPRAPQNLTLHDMDGDGLQDVIVPNTSVSDTQGGIWFLRQR